MKWVYSFVLLFCLIFSGVSVFAADNTADGLEVRAWTIKSGSTLKSTLEDWSRISNERWSVIWEHPSDYRIQTSTVFHGSFEDVVGLLVTAVYRNAPELSVTLYRGNNVVHVTVSSNIHE